MEQLVRLHERHVRTPRMIAVLDAYELAFNALLRLAGDLRALEEHRQAAGIDARAHDLFLQAVRHIDAMVQRAAKDEP